MQCSRRVFPALFILFFVALSASGQVASSPFSKFGVGELNNGGIAQNQGMGGLGISNPTGWYLNNINPALLVFNRVTVFQGGMQMEKNTAYDGTNTQSFASGNLNYLAIAFPVMAGKWTTSVGTMPYSSVSYNLSYQTLITGSSNIPMNVQETGKGGISQFYWSNGVALNRYFSLGVKASYLFGAINIKDFNTLSGVAVNNYSALVSQYSFGGTNFTGGISFHKDSLFKKNYRLNIGLIYSLRTNTGVKHKATTESISLSGVVIDSTTISNLSAKFTLPQSFGAGISFGKIDHWTAGADFTLLDYKNYESYQIKFPDYNQYSQTREVPTTSYRASIGGEIIPKGEDYTNYLNRVAYRVGATYERFPFLVNGNPLTDIAGTFGFSLPVNGFSTVDLGVRIGQRGIVSQNSLQENYFRIYFGITFNDRWFIKRKFD